MRCGVSGYAALTRPTGLIGARLYVLVFTLRETAVRIISLRKANSREVKRYVAAVP